MGGSFTDNWPRWPANTTGKEVFAVRVGCSVDKLFEIAFAKDSDFKRKCGEVKNDKDAATSDWLNSESAVDGVTLVPGDKPKEAPPQSSDLEGWLQKHSCSSLSMGMKYKVEDIARVVVAKAGKEYVVEACVATTATYGDRMRSVVRSKLEAAGPDKCTWTAEFVIVYLSSVNALIKKAIDRGATGGITKNFELTRQALSDFYDVKDKSAPEDEPAVPTPAQPAAAPAPVRPVRRGILRQALHADYVLAWQPISQWTVAHVKAAGIPLPVRASEDLALSLAVLMLLLVLSGLLRALHFISVLAASLPGIVGQACGAALDCMDAPQTVRSVLLGVALLAACHQLLAHAAKAFVPAAVSEGRAISRRQSCVTDDLDVPRAGVMFDGYNQALETAAAKITDAASDLCKPVLPPSPSRQTDKTAVTSKDNFKTGVKNMYRDMRDAWKLATNAMTEAEFPPPSQSKPASPEAAVPIARSKSAAATPASAAASRAHTEAQELPPVLPGDVAGSSGATSPVGDGPASPGPKSPPAGASAGNQLKARKSGPTNSGQLAAAFNKGSMLASLGLGRTSAGPGSAAAAGLADRKDSDTAKGTQAQQAPGLEAASAASHGSSAADSPRLQQRASGPVEEEVFEHERYQPFLAWGHRYPGHFLPTDRVGHWGVLTGKDLGKDLSKFDEVAPKLPKGWHWQEAEWHVDKAGLDTVAVDAEGWSYAVDFPWLHHPPVPGAGRFKRVRDYIRRRRWVRTRVADDIPPSQQQQQSATVENGHLTPFVRSASPDAVRQSSEAKPAAGASPREGSPLSPASPGRRVRIADIQKPDDGSSRGPLSLLTDSLLGDVSSLMPGQATGETAMSTADGAPMLMPEASAASVPNARPSTAVSASANTPLPAAAAAAPPASPHMATARSLSCPEDLQLPLDADPSPGVRDQQYNPHLTMVQHMDRTSPQLHVSGSAFDAIAQFEDQSAAAATASPPPQHPKQDGDTSYIPDAESDTPHSQLLDLSPAAMRSASPLASTLDPFAASQSSTILASTSNEGQTHGASPSATQQPQLAGRQHEQTLHHQEPDSSADVGQADLSQRSENAGDLNSRQWPQAPSWH